MSNSQLYTGYTTDLKRRYTEHAAGKVHTTSRYLPVRLIFYEAYLNKKDAVRRETYLKSSKGKQTLRLMLTETLETL